MRKVRLQAQNTSTLNSTTGVDIGPSNNYTYEMINQDDNASQTHHLVDSYSAYNLAMGGTTTPSSHVTVLKRDAQEAGLSNPSADDSSDTDDEHSSKPSIKPGKKTKGRVKIKMEFIQNKLRRYTTFSKRKTGIMKKAYELSTLTGTQVMLLVASETGHVYTFATRKLQPMITSDSGKALIQTCLNSPDVSGAQNDQRMNPTGYEETELNYAVSEEEMRGMEPGAEPVREASPTSDPDNHVIHRFAPVKNESRPPWRLPVGAHRKEKRHLLHPRPMYMAQQQRHVAIGASTSATINGTSLPIQVSSGALQLNMDGFQTDASGQQYVTIPLPVTMANIQPVLTGHHAAVRLAGQHTTLSGQNHLAGLALDAHKQ